MGTVTKQEVPFVDLAAQYATIAEEIDEAIARVLRNTDFILGRDVQLFEEEFAAFCDSPHAIGVDSGMSALELILRGYEIGAGDEVITPANTFIATALSISNAGAKPVMVDVMPGTYRMDLDQLEAAITERTCAIMPVHLYGHPEDMDPIMELADRYSLLVLEDACQAHGARYKGRRAGSIGQAAAFSFYPGKNLGAYGDGGMIVTRDAGLAGRIKLLRNYGQSKKYHHVVQGGNNRLDSLQAAVLRVKLRYLDAWNAARRAHATRYSELLDSKLVELPSVADWAEPIWHLYVIQVDQRDALRDFLADHGVSAGIHYPIPIHRQPAYADLGLGTETYAVAEREADRIISLPMYAELTPDHIEYVAGLVNEFLSA